MKDLGKAYMKRLFWIGSSREDFKGFPDEVQDEMGHGRYLAQMATDINMQNRLVD